MPTETERIQDAILTAVNGKPKVALDTCCVQYYISDPPVQPWADCLNPIFQAGVEKKVELYVSTVVISELLAHVLSNRQNMGYDPELNLLAIINRHFQILDVNREVALAAGRLRGDKGALKTPDALIGATSMTNGHTLFITNDAQLANALPDPNCIYLRNVALEWLEQNFSALCLCNNKPILPSRRGRGLPTGIPSPLELGGIRTDPSVRWRRILKDAYTVAIALNEPCVFFVLSVKNGRRIETQEVIFWHEGLRETRQPVRILRRLREHLEITWDKTEDRYKANPKKYVYSFAFCTLAHERERLKQPAFASKNDYQKEADAWNKYLSMWRVFRECLEFPQTTWILCENGTSRPLDIAAMTEFLSRAKNVLGWEDEK